MFRVAWISCEKPSITNLGGQYLANTVSPDVLFTLGDIPYMAFNVDGWGYNLNPIDKDSTQADFEEHYEQTFAKPEWLNIFNKVPTRYKIDDDHEWGGDDWDHTLTQSEDPGAPIGATTQAEVDAHYKAGTDASIAIATKYFHNVANTDVEAVVEKPSEADAGTPASNYAIKYFRVGYDVNGTVSTSPVVEFFAVDCISYRSPLADVDNSSKTMLGANQKAWLKAKLLASTATFKVIVSSKKTYKATAGDNSDTFGEYTTELEEIIDYIGAQSITGVLWISGDKHRPSVTNTATGGSTNNIDHCCVVACPLGVAVNAEMSYTNGHVWQGARQCVGYIDVTATKLTITIESINGNPMWSGELLAGANIITYPAQQVAI